MPSLSVQYENTLSIVLFLRLQEMDLSVGTYLIDNTKKMEEWLSCITASLPGGSKNFKIVRFRYRFSFRI